MVTRVSGLMSGMDIDQIVSDLMRARRQPMIKLQQQKQWIEWQREKYREINTKIFEFRNKLFDFKLEGTLTAKKISVSGNTAAVAAKATGAAQPGTLSIEVKGLAKAASNYSSSAIATAAFNPNKTLSSESTAGNLTGGTLSGTYSFKINGVQIDVNPAEDSLNKVIERINKNTNVTAFYDEETRSVSFVSKETGTVNHSPDGKNITFEDVTGDFLENFLFVTNGSANETDAEDATVIINGLETTRKSNKFTVNGIEITLQGTNVGDPAKIDVVTDTDKIVDSVKKFIEDYNNLMGTLYNAVRESRYRNFPPLTEEQKKEMSEKDIELWEEKAKSGLLRSDSILLKTLSNLRSAIVAQVETGSDTYKTLSSIGIETGEYYENGKLYLRDESKLRKAIEEDPQAFFNLFGADGSGDGQRSDMGIAERIYADLKTAMDELTSKAGVSTSLRDNSLLSKQLESLDERIDAWNERLNTIENRYYHQFTIMEQAINRYNMQSAYLMNQFGGGQY